MTADESAGPTVGPADFWSARPLNRAMLVLASLFATVSFASDFANAITGSGTLDAPQTLVILLNCLAIYVLWTRTTFAFAALIPALVASHLLDAFWMTSLVVPLLLGAVAATAQKSFSLVALAVSVAWTLLIPFTTTTFGPVVWVALIFVALGWGVGNFVGFLLDRRLQDQARVAEATRRAARAAQEERKSLARDLHDIVAHNLTIISMQTRAAQYAGTDEAARHAVDVVGHSATEALADLRRMLSLLQAEGLVAGDQEAAQIELGEGAAALDLEYGAVKFGRMLEGLGIETHVETEGLDQDIPRSVQTALYRVLQEAVTNVAKHAAEGGQCRICIRVNDDRLELAVDNTLPVRGAPARAGWNSSGSGLIGMRDRVDAFGGTMSSQRDGSWWRVRAEVPLQEAAA
ncbi:sensor histidine kinase [Citricoccus sp.]|uniref:sensor histidine kinase n=1 Tax=Citricoccus sp. TaxID=1978372 RepID=UPI0026313008|nr:histidine kinase [Citricoccus sp.]HRO31147.1 histidine kinase [Citricoccus sp.]HRO94642.1 histidine kinase [Citricoccus sp.]